METIVKRVLSGEMLSAETKYFVIGGPVGDFGFTGRKIHPDVGSAASHLSQDGGQRPLRA